ERVEEIVLGIELRLSRVVECVGKRYRLARRVIRDLGVAERVDDRVLVGRKSKVGTVESAVECGDHEGNTVRFFGIVLGRACGHSETRRSNAENPPAGTQRLSGGDRFSVQ